MINSAVLGVFILIDFIFIMYSFFDTYNRVYGNIIAGIISSILSFQISYFIIGGNVIERTTVIQDGSIGYFFILVGLIMVIVTILNIFDVIYGDE